MNSTFPVVLHSPATATGPSNMSCLHCDKVNLAPPEMGSRGPEVVSEEAEGDMGRVYFTGMALLVILATIFGNTLVIVAVCTEKRLRKVGNSFIVNLAISDLVVGLFIAPLALVYYLDKDWQLGPLFCDIWISTDVVCCTASIVNLCVISFDRYNAITSPLQYAFKRTPKRAAIIITFVWLYSFLIAVPPLLGWKNERSIGECRVSQVVGYTLFSTIGAFYIPLVIMLVMYVRIFRATLKRKQTWLPGPTCTTTAGTTRRTEIAVLINATESVRKHYEKQCTAQNSDSNDNKVCAASTLRVTGITRICDRKESCPRSEDSCVSAESATSSPCLTYASRSNSRTNQGLLDVPKFPPPEASEKTVAIRLSTTDMAALTTSFCTSNQADDSTLSGNHGNADCLVHGVGFCADGRLSPVVNRSLSGSATSCQESSCIESVDTHVVTDKNSITCEQRPRVRKLAPLINRRRRQRRKNKISLSQEKTAARTLGIIIGGFVVCWLPFFVLTLINPLCGCNIRVVFRDTFTWMGYSNSALNPIIYTFFNPDFRVAFRNILSCLSCKK